MKKILLAMAFLATAPAFANELEALLQSGRNTVFCYYKNQHGYTFGAGGTSIGQAKTRAYSECVNSDRGGRLTSPAAAYCTFAGCRSVR